MKATVIIPHVNELEIHRLLDALRVQTYKNFDIIIYEDSNRQGPATTRNKGVARAKGSIIIFIDADCVPEPDFVEQMMVPFKDKKVVGVQGVYKTYNKSSWIARYVGYEIAFRHDRMRKLKSICHIGTFAAAYRKKVFKSVGGFDTYFKTANGEDTELSYKLEREGYKLVLNNKAVVSHPHPTSLYQYLHQQFLSCLLESTVV